MAIVQIWVTKGLVSLTLSNMLNQIPKNIAYFVELYLQISADDPSYASRTSNQKKMVSLSNPPTTNPVYPVAVVSMVSLSGYAVGKDPARYDYQVQIALIGKKNQESKLEKLMTNLLNAIHDERSALYDVGMFYTRDAIPSSYSPFHRDSDNPELLYGAMTFNFYSII